MKAIGLTLMLVVSSFAFVALPQVALAQGLVPCGADANANKFIDPAERCDFSDIITLVQNVLDTLIYVIASPIAALMFGYAGYLYLTAQDNESQVKQAHDIFVSVFWGYVIMLGAWVLVNFIFDLLVNDPSVSLLS